MRKQVRPFVCASSPAFVVFLLTTLTATGITWARSPDWTQPQRFRLGLTVTANGYARHDLPVDLTVDLGARLAELSADGPLHPGSVRVVEVDSEGGALEAAVPFQFNPNSANPGKGTVVFLLGGDSDADAQRRFFIYFDTVAGPAAPQVEPLVNLTDGVEFRGQESYRIETPAATYYYHQRGAGFAALVDRDGKDWIGYRAGGGSAGDYRGIPNLVHPDGYFHPGSTKCTSRIFSQGPLRVLIDSQSEDGQWRCVWGIYPEFARLAVVRAPKAYWFLYEGTPGGQLDEKNQFYGLSDGSRRGVGERFAGDIPSPEWLFFAAPSLDRSLYLVHHHDDDQVDAYWPMQGNMTVFGFGRSELKKSLTRTPAFFTVGLAESTDQRALATTINGVFQPTNVKLGKAESRDGRALVAVRPASPDVRPGSPDPGRDNDRRSPPSTNPKPPPKTPAAPPKFDWPHWRGPHRNDIVAEDSGYDAGGWPPREVWQKNVGEGSSSPLVVRGALYVMGSNGGRDLLHCLDAARGTERWQVSYQAPRYGRHATGDQGLYASITSTPEFDPQTGLLYSLGADGDLICWDTADRGRRVWSLNLYDEYRMERREKIARSGQRDYGYTTAPLVYQDWLLVEVGGNRGTVMAFDKLTGKALWGGECRDKAGHTGGLVPLTVEGVPCVAVLTLHHLLVVRLDPPHQGQTVARHPWTTEFANNIASAAAEGNEVLISSGYNHQAICKLRITLRGAEPVWERPEFSNICTPVIYQGNVYWASKQPYCLDFATGRLRWTGPRKFGDAGSCIVTADERLIIWAKRGDLVLAELAERSPNQYQELVRLDGLFPDDAWPHVVLANGRLYLKDRRGNLKCLQIGGKPAEEGSSPAVASRPNNPRPTTPSAAGTSPAPARLPLPKIDPAALKSWPGTAPGLILAWRRGLELDKLVSTVDRAANQWKLVPRDNARLSSSGELETTGGAFLVQGAGQSLLAACRSTNQLSVEAVLSPANTNQIGPARIISFSTDPYVRNFTLGQDRDHLVLRLRTPRTGENGMNPETQLCKIQAGRPQHVLVTYRDGEVVCYLNGQEAARSSAVRGDLSNWTTQHLLLGDEWQDSRHWHGRIERLALHNRFIGPEEAKQCARLSLDAPR